MFDEVESGPHDLNAKLPLILVVHGVVFEKYSINNEERKEPFVEFQKIAAAVPVYPLLIVVNEDSLSAWKKVCMEVDEGLTPQRSYLVERFTRRRVYVDDGYLF